MGQPLFAATESFKQGPASLNVLELWKGNDARKLWGAAQE
jgi:hypothetical protein